MRLIAAAADTAVVRPLWRADCMAGAAVQRVFRPPGRVRVCACRGRVRRARSSHRGGLEGARAAAARRMGCFGRRRNGRSPGCRMRCVRPGRCQSPPAPWSPPGRAARTGARVDMGARARAGARACPRLAPAAGLDQARSPAQRRRGLSCRAARSVHSRAGRRHLHHGSDRECVGLRPPQGRGAACRSCDVRPDDSHPLRRCSRSARVRLRRGRRRSWRISCAAKVRVPAHEEAECDFK